MLQYIYADIANELYLERKYKVFLDFFKLYSKREEYDGVVPKWLRELSAKQLFTGANPVHASSYAYINESETGCRINVIRRHR